MILEMQLKPDLVQRWRRPWMSEELGLIVHSLTEALEASLRDPCVALMEMLGTCKLSQQTGPHQPI